MREFQDVVMIYGNVITQEFFNAFILEVTGKQSRMPLIFQCHGHRDIIIIVTIVWDLTGIKSILSLPK